MPRPKCTRFVGVKMPDVLYGDIEVQCARITGAMRRRVPGAKQMLPAQWIKDACEFRLTLTKGLLIGYYALREVPDAVQPENGLPEVQPS